MAFLLFKLYSFLSNYNALKKHERLCNNHDHCEIIMPEENKNILKYNNGEKSLKVPHVIYADNESLLIKQQSSQNKPENSFTEKKSVHEACGYALNSVTSYNPNKNTHIFYRGIASMKKK